MSSPQQTYAYSNMYNSYVEGNQLVSNFINALTTLCIKIRFMNIPDSPNNDKKTQFFTLVKENLLSNSPLGQAPNAIYKMFLINLLEKIPSLTDLECFILSNNLHTLENADITGVIEYNNGIISNSDLAYIISKHLENKGLTSVHYKWKNIDDPGNPNDIIFTGSNGIKRVLAPYDIISTQFAYSPEYFNNFVNAAETLKMNLPTSRGKAPRTPILTRKNKSTYGKSPRTPTHTQKNTSPYKKTPNAKTPCKYGSACYQKSPEHHTKYLHPNKGGKRASKKVYKCVRQTKKKYTTRASPPYPAQECPYQKKKGNDGRMYVSKPNDINGIFRWVAQ